MIIKRSFYERDTALVARELLGTKLVREYSGVHLSAVISETEAYLGEHDSACHGYCRRRTRRNEVLYGTAGVAYVYFVYGLHNMLNVVTGKVDEPCAVLIRAIIPLEGIETMARIRGMTKNLADGPGKLCSALSIDRQLNGADMTAGEKLWIEMHETVPENQVLTGPRIRIGYATPQDQNAPLRFRIQQHS